MDNLHALIQVRKGLLLLCNPTMWQWPMEILPMSRTLDSLHLFFTYTEVVESKDMHVLL
jgi:hypothetical protein